MYEEEPQYDFGEDQLSFAAEHGFFPVEAQS